MQKEFKSNRKSGRPPKRNERVPSDGIYLVTLLTNRVGLTRLGGHLFVVVQVEWDDFSFNSKQAKVYFLSSVDIYQQLSVYIHLSTN